jgi:adenosylcobyric acid synthase
MVQGTGSSVGKSVIATALCRLFRDDGYRVAPFKAVNMSNNAGVTPDGGEIGRAQFVQALAAGVTPSVDMNPVLLKPESDTHSQVVVQGRSVRGTPDVRAAIAESFARLRREFDIIVLEGAGSPAEINLRDRDFANMHAAELADAPVILVGDIDRGGIFAAFVGTLELISPSERERVVGFIINRFRGDRALLEPGLDWLRERTGSPVFGVLPWLHDLGLADEDACAITERPQRGKGPLEIVVVHFPCISNFDDLDPLAAEPAVRIRFTVDPDALAAADLVVLPGSKSTVADLAWLRARGFAEALAARAKTGAPILGLCGGCQMLGLTIEDPTGVESLREHAQGLGLLPLRTRFLPDKITRQVQARAQSPCFLTEDVDGDVDAYEIHAGRVESDHPAPFSAGGGAIAGTVVGTLLHGLFTNAPVRRALVQFLARRRGIEVPLAAPQDPYARLAAAAREHLDWPAISAVARRGR